MTSDETVESGILVVFSSPASADVAAEFDTWYDSVHLPQLQDIAGVVRASRWKAAASSGDSPLPTFADHHNLALYEIEAADLEAVIHEIKERAQDGRLTMSPALNRDDAPPLMMLFRRHQPKTPWS